MSLLRQPVALCLFACWVSCRCVLQAVSLVGGRGLSTHVWLWLIGGAVVGGGGEGEAVHAIHANQSNLFSAYLAVIAAWLHWVAVDGLRQHWTARGEV